VRQPCHWRRLRRERHQEKHHFTSYERDGESTTDYAVNRQYSQSIGKFTSVDPQEKSAKREVPQSWNRYVEPALDIRISRTVSSASFEPPELTTLGSRPAPLVRDQSRLRSISGDPGSCGDFGSQELADDNAVCSCDRRRQTPCCRGQEKVS